MSIEFYDANCDRYFEETVSVDLSELRGRFSAYVPKGGRILDAGCGSGRDALAFSQAGYCVTAIDGSLAMANRAGVHTGLPVQHLTFEEVSWSAEFDGVWACASLLHVPRAALNQVMTRLTKALRPSGALFASFKSGNRDREHGGRHFTDMTSGELRLLFERANLEVQESWQSRDARPARAGNDWENGIGLKLTAKR